MAQAIMSFSRKVVVGVVADPFDFRSKERFYPADKLDEIESLFGRVTSDNDLGAALELWDELDKIQGQQIAAYETEFACHGNGD